MTDFRTIQELARIPRGEHGELRIELTECSDDRGNASQFVNLRLWFKGDRGDWLPGKQGLSIRTTELLEVGKALRTAFDGMSTAQQTRSSPSPQRSRPAPRRRSVADPDEDLSCGGAL
jgi:hypothetical protein